MTTPMFDSFANITSSAPDLTNSPSLASGVATSSTFDPSGDAQTVAQASQVSALQQQVTAHVAKHGRGFWGTLWHDTGGAALNYMQKPLQEIQHDYRYLRDVYDKHGWGAGLAETAGIIGAGIAGTVLSGGNIAGGIAAADATAAGLAHVFYSDSYKRTSDPNYMLDGHLVSPGRDLASVFGLDVTSHQGQGGGLGRWVSGVTDAGFDMTVDPLNKLGALSKAAKFGGLAERAAAAENAAKNLEQAGRFEAAAKRVQAAAALVQKHAPGLRMVSPDQVDNLLAVRMGGSYRRALADIASKNTAADIINAYPEYEGLAPALAKAADVGAVHQIFRDAVAERQMIGQATQNLLPSRAALRVPFAKINAYLDSQGMSFADESSAIRGIFPRPLEAFRQQDPTLLIPSPITGLKGIASRGVRTFTGYVATSLDPSTIEQSGKVVNPEATDFGRTVLSVLNYGMSKPLAKTWLQRILDAPTESAKFDLYKVGVQEMMKQAGLADQPHVIEALMSKIDQSVHAGRGFYGQGLTLGDEVNKVGTVAADGVEYTDRSALWGYQRGDWALPDFKELHGAIRDLHAGTRIFGRLDMWGSHIINNVFKPLTLVSAGFGTRIAMAEALPASMRFGALNYLRAMAGSRAGKLGYKLMEGSEDYTDPMTGLRGATDEAGHVNAAVVHAAGGMVKLLRSPKEFQEDLHDLIITSGGHTVTGAVSATGKNTFLVPDEPVSRAGAVAWYLPGADKRITTKFAGDFRRYTTTEEQHIPLWHGNLSRLANEPGAQRIAADLVRMQSPISGMTREQAVQQAIKNEAARIRGLDPATGKVAETDPYALERKTIRRFESQDPEQFATHRVDDVRNYISRPDGTLHDWIATALAHGDHPSEAQLEDIPIEDRPAYIKGAVEIPQIGDNLFQRVISFGFTRVVDPIVQHLSREPIYALNYHEQMKTLRYAVDHGVLTHDEAINAGKYRAAKAMLPQIHNVHLRSQFATLVNNLLPFYFAQEQAIRRTAYLIARNPEAIRKYQMVQNGLNDPGFVHTDQYGNKSLMLPGVGFAGQAFFHAVSALDKIPGAQGVFPVQTGLPLSYSGDLQSLQSVLPELKAPGVSPFVSIPLTWLKNVDPQFTGYIDAVLGRGATSTIQDDLVPNAFLRNVIKGLTADDADRSFSNAYTGALAAAAYHGQIPPPDATPAEQQAFMDRIKNNTRSLFFLKALVGFFSPLSPQGNPEDYGLRDEFYKMAKTEGSYSAAADKFLKEHGNRAISYTVAKSDTTTGANIPSTAAALAYLNGNQQLLTGPLGIGASFLAPQAASQDHTSVHNELLAMHIQENRSPADFRDALYTQIGDQQFFSDFAVHKANLKKVEGDTQATDAENAAWHQYVGQLTLQNPIWAQTFFSPEKTQLAQRAYVQLQELFATGQAPIGEQTDLVRGLMNDYQTHLANLAALGTDRSLSHARTAEKNAWASYLADTMNTTPQLSNIIRTVFNRLG